METSLAGRSGCGGWRRASAAMAAGALELAAARSEAAVSGALAVSAAAGETVCDAAGEAGILFL